MTTAKWRSIQARSRIHAILVQDLMKRSVCRCGVEMPLGEHEGVFSKRIKENSNISPCANINLLKKPRKETNILQDIIALRLISSFNTSLDETQSP
jgi:hypothetical protein